MVSYVGGPSYSQDAIVLLENGYCGSWEDRGDWAYDYLNDTGALDAMPENLRCYFDFDSFARDCELNGDILTFDVDGRVAIFWAR